MKRAALLISTVVFAASTASLGYAQPAPRLSDDEVAAAMAVEASAIEELRGGVAIAPMATFAAEVIPSLRSTKAGVEGKSVVTGVTAVASRTEAQPADRALVTRYDYGTGLTIRTLVDLGAKQALQIKADANFPTPLEPEEQQTAIEIAGRAVPEIAQPGDTAESEPRLLPIIDSVPASETYGHRLVVVWREDLPRTQRVLVDLTTEAVANPNY